MPESNRAPDGGAPAGAAPEQPEGCVVAGVLAPHPPHLVYADNAPQNEPRSEGGWEELRWGYERLRRSLDALDYDVILVHTPHWKTVVGTHFLGLPRFASKSVDPIFPNLFRYSYELEVDVELSRAIHDAAAEDGLVTRMMENPDFRIDYGTITACHLVNPKWDKPIVVISSNRAYFYYSSEVGDEEMLALGRATARAVKASGKRCLLLASNSLSHRHFTEEPDPPEDMSREHVYNHNQYMWDMRVLGLMREGKTRQLIDEMPDFIEHALSECNDGSLTWLIGALDFPSYPAEVHAYGSVIGTGNAIVEWQPAWAAGGDGDGDNEQEEQR